ncbi:NAT10 [Bugula neritina]|uniref:NAT10 n=1 Tax=Bugula neritina TaxID=10212 RepID=A0A7J7J545_BUGNE|nr:NAT10 [Bugula neritina]
MDYTEVKGQVVTSSPWTISQQFRNDKFAQMSGARIVRIATHPDYQGRGYGKRAINVLESYYKHKIPSNIEEPKATTFKDAILETNNLLKEVIKPRSSTELPPLISKLSERKPESLDYLGVSYGLTSDLLRFWKKCGFLPVYLRQTQNALTGENSCIMLKILNEEEKREDESSWLKTFNQDFRRRFISLLSYQFKSYLPSMALSLLQVPKTAPESGESKSATASKKLTSNDLSCYFTHNDIERLKAYSNKLVDYHLIMDLVPQIAKLYFIGNMPDVNLAIVQQALLLGTGLQHKQVDELEEELHLSSTQILGVLYKVIRKCYQPISCVGEEDAKIKLLERDNTTTDLTCQSLCQGEGEVKTSREISHNKTAKERLSIKRTDGNKKKRKLSIEADLGAARKKKEKRETLAQS